MVVVNHTMRWLASVGLVVLAVALSGSAMARQEATDDAPMLEADPVNQVEGEPPIQPGGDPLPIEPMYGPLVEFAVNDLATRLAIDATSIEPLEARAVVWPDGALGCPMPGMAYIQVQVEGALVRLRVDGKVYEYHSGGSRPPFLCDKPAAPPAPPPGGSTAV